MNAEAIDPESSNVTARFGSTAELRNNGALGRFSGAATAPADAARATAPATSATSVALRE